MNENLKKLAVKKTLKSLKKAKIILTSAEKSRIEIADFGLNDLNNIGLQIFTYVNTNRVCAKELVLFPYQTCPEHKHIPTKLGPGKEETFRCRKGTVYLYIPGPEKTLKRGILPNTKVTVFHEIVLNEGDQYTLNPETLHWFRAGPKGAIISEFSTTSTDETDYFTDPRIIR